MVYIITVLKFQIVLNSLNSPVKYGFLEFFSEFFHWSWSKPTQNSTKRSSILSNLVKESSTVDLAFGLNSLFDED